MSHALLPNGLQYAWLLCPSLSPRVFSNSSQLSQLSHPTIQPSHPLLPPSPPAFNLSQHQGLFQWVYSLHQVVKVLELQFQHQSFQWIFRVDFLLGLTGLISLLSKVLSRVFSRTTFQKHRFFSVYPPLYPTLTSIYDYWKNHSFD